MEYRFRPIHQWPRPFTRDRQYDRFRVSYSESLDHLKSELEKLGAKNVVIQADFREGDIRMDGMPKANARKPGHPGIILTFDSRKGSLTFVCDRFTDWQANIRAIGMTLERLRLVDLYGVTQSSEQYKGWAALPAAGGSETFCSKQQAAEWVSRESEGDVATILLSPKARTNAYRDLTRRFHPDNAGDPADFRRLQNAKEILEKS